MKETPALSPTMASRKLQVLAFIEIYYAHNGVGPSLGEIANAVDINRMRALDAVNTLHKEGRIHRTLRQARSIRPLSAEEEAIRRLQGAGYAVTKDGLPDSFDLDHIPADDGEKSKTGKAGAARRSRG